MKSVKRKNDAHCKNTRHTIKKRVKYNKLTRKQRGGGGEISLYVNIAELKNFINITTENTADNAITTTQPSAGDKYSGILNVSSIQLFKDFKECVTYFRNVVNTLCSNNTSLTPLIGDNTEKMDSDIWKILKNDVDLPKSVANVDQLKLFMNYMKALFKSPVSKIPHKTFGGFGRPKLREYIASNANLVFGVTCNTNSQPPQVTSAQSQPAAAQPQQAAQQQLQQQIQFVPVAAPPVVATSMPATTHQNFGLLKNLASSFGKAASSLFATGVAKAAVKSAKNFAKKENFVSTPVVPASTPAAPESTPEPTPAPAPTPTPAPAPAPSAPPTPATPESIPTTDSAVVGGGLITKLPSRNTIRKHRAIKNKAKRSIKRRS